MCYFWSLQCHSPVPPRTREHRASIGKGEMSLTMCGCFQLTSEACYKYSDGAHCAHRCLPEKTNRCKRVSRLNLDILSRAITRATQVGGSITERAQTACLHLLTTISVTVTGIFFQMSAIFFSENRDHCVWRPRWQTEWQIRSETIAPTPPWAPDNISMATVAWAAHKAFFFFFPFNSSGTVNQKKKLNWTGILRDVAQ